jgi:hypothetical protein
MPNFIHVNVDDFGPRKEVSYGNGDVVTIFIIKN